MSEDGELRESESFTGRETDTEHAEGFTDVSQLAAQTISSPSTLEHTSDVLYIVREGNYLLELSEALETTGVDLKEEIDEPEVRKVES